MADYIYLLDHRLSAAQKQALASVREVARGKGLTIFLVGGAVRDLTSGSPVRDLDVAVQGNALKLRKDLELAGGVVTGTHDAAQVLHMRFPGGVRVEVGSTMSSSYPKPGKPLLKPGTILEDLRRRDFTANAMALSLNDGSYGLLMDPLNGVADIENRELRLASNYGFIEEPVRMIRAMRFAARLGWTLEEKTQGRYETGKQEGYISGLHEFHRGYEAEEILHEEDPLRVMRRLEAEGWMQVIAPAWSSAKANTVELEKVRESQTQMQMQGIHPDASAVNFPLLTAKMAAKDVEALKKSFPRQGFVAEIDGLEAEAKEFASQLGSKAAALASASYRVIRGARPEAVLQVVHATKSVALQAKFKSFFGEWPQVRQKIPLVLMVEMRITPEIAGYEELVEKLFFELMDGNLTTVEEIRAFLEPYSPPAPPPPVHLRRPRAARKDAKKGRVKKGAVVAVEDDGDDEDAEEGAADPDGDEDGEDEVEGLGGRAAFRADVERERKAAGAEEEDEEEDEADEPPHRAPAVREEVAPEVGQTEAAASREVVPVSKPAGSGAKGTPLREDVARPVLVKGPAEGINRKGDSNPKSSGQNEANGSRKTEEPVAAATAAKTVAMPAKKVASAPVKADPGKKVEKPAEEVRGANRKVVAAKVVAARPSAKVVAVKPVVKVVAAKPAVKTVAVKAVSAKPSVRAVPARVVKEMAEKRAATSGASGRAGMAAAPARGAKQVVKRSR